MIWGYALIWPGNIGKGNLLGRLEFLAPYGLKSTGAGLSALEDLSPGDRDAIATLLDENDMRLTLHPRIPYMEDRDTVKRAVDDNLRLIEKYRNFARSWLVTTAAGKVHRFMRSPDPTLEEQMEKLVFGLEPLARGCHDLGLNLGIENHADYYVSDLVELCRQVPHLGIFLDTGNCCIMGEKGVPAFQEAAPFTVGSHFKDHRVQPRPDARPLHFEVAPAVIGEGDVPLTECWDILKRDCPHWERLVMEIELIPPSDRPFLESFEASVRFVKNLPQS